MSATLAVRSRRGWRLHPQVALRPEPFGALLYHFGTRKLSFLKDRTVVGLVRSLPSTPSARAALQRGGRRRHRPVRDSALAALADSQMLVRSRL